MPSKPAWLIFLVVLTAWGCDSPTIPDPNDPSQVGNNQTRVLQANIKAVTDAANRRVFRREITPDMAKVLINRYEADLCRDIDVSKIKPEEAYIYGQIFLDAQDWENARKTLTIAVANAKDVDRKVNDTIRLAHAYAQLGSVQKAIELVRSTFSTDPQDKAPILPGVMFDIVPSGVGKGEDVALASLLQDAVRQEEQVVVDPKLASAQLFLTARPGLINQAWVEVVRLYRVSGRPDLAARAMRSAEADESTRRGV